MSNTTTETRRHFGDQANKRYDEAVLLVQRTEALLEAEAQRAERLMKHHVQCALTLLYHAMELVDFPDVNDLTYHEMQNLMELLRELTPKLRSRLDPVFSRSDLFDPDGRFLRIGANHDAQRGVSQKC